MRIDLMRHDLNLQSKEEEEEVKKSDAADLEIIRE